MPGIAATGIAGNRVAPACFSVSNPRGALSCGPRTDAALPYRPRAAPPPTGATRASSTAVSCLFAKRGFLGVKHSRRECELIVPGSLFTNRLRGGAGTACCSPLSLLPPPLLLVCRLHISHGLRLRVGQQSSWQPAPAMLTVSRVSSTPTQASVASMHFHQAIANSPTYR